MDNTLIAQSLGKYGIICMEDMNHDIYMLENVSKKQAASCDPLNVFSIRRNEEKDHPFCRRWRCWQLGRLDQQAY